MCKDFKIVLYNGIEAVGGKSEADMMVGKIIMETESKIGVDNDMREVFVLDFVLEGSEDILFECLERPSYLGERSFEGEVMFLLLF